MATAARLRTSGGRGQPDETTIRQAQQLLAQYAGIWSGVLGRWSHLDTLRTWGDRLGTKGVAGERPPEHPVVIGYDDDRKVVILHDPSFGPAWEVGYDDFEMMWALFDHFYVVMYPPDFAKRARHALGLATVRGAYGWSPRGGELRVRLCLWPPWAGSPTPKERLAAGLGAPDILRGTGTSFCSSWRV